MSPSLIIVLTLISGISWSIVYIDIINRGFKDKTYGMPLFALAFNIAWEFIYGILVGQDFNLEKVIYITWFILDAIIIYTYFKNGRKEFPLQYQKYFIPWSVTAFVIGVATLYFARMDLGDNSGAIYSAFGQNLMMSVLFIGMLVRRNNVDGQSIYIAILKCLGTLAPTIQFYIGTGSLFVLILGIGIFIYDVIYIGMLYRKFYELGLNPFTRKPVLPVAKVTVDERGFS
jgi:hypothetical protein